MKLPLSLLAVWVLLLTGCAGTFPQWQPDRCHRSETGRDTLYWDVFCVQGP